MRRQAPRRDRLEHVILQDEILGVRPVVGDLPGVVIAHDIGRPGRQAHGGRRVGRAAAAVAAQLGGPDKAVHPATVDVSPEAHRTVPAAAVYQARIVIRPVAACVRGSGAQTVK